MSRPARAQQTSVRKLVVVKLGRMSKAFIDRRARRAVARAIAVLSDLREHADVVALADDDEGDLGVDAHCLAGGLDLGQLVVQHVLELPFGHAVAVEDDACACWAAWFEFGAVPVVFRERELEKKKRINQNCIHRKKKKNAP